MCLFEGNLGFSVHLQMDYKWLVCGNMMNVLKAPPSPPLVLYNLMEFLVKLRCHTNLQYSPSRLCGLNSTCSVSASWSVITGSISFQIMMIASII